MHRDSRIKANAIVFYKHDQLVAASLQKYVDARGLGVTNHVGQGFLHDAIEGCLGVCRQAAVQSYGLKLHDNAMPVAHLLRVLS